MNRFFGALAFLSFMVIGQANEQEAWTLQEDECSAEDCGLSLRQLRGEKASEEALIEDELELNLDDEEEEFTTEAANISANGEWTFYAYRSKTDSTYEDTNVNMANLAGVMWYLHNEVVGHCPRKFGITRLLRYKITLHPTAALKQTGKNYAPLCHFDRGACTGPLPVLKDYDKFGFVVGCDKPSFHQASYYKATWYSFPGECPSKPIESKTSSCKQNSPGGLCKPGEPWSKTCTWRKEPAGEITLDDLTHNFNFDKRCKKGFYEYDEKMDRGQGTNFWHGKKDWRVCNRRLGWVKKVWHKKYPSMPSLPDGPECEYGDPKR
mmetsp:Transcript_47867/g.86361  ORF Transcript_47867/g.86361 Transcript_47867/m.86361 type:complete len:322 (+) Transcript_47867:60-1025(+)|eukprot:CAMPEP_0197648852 /NCGR_PEP_ID=MMETSP1338-20131121/28000_1 /TAXON_ID=43686 ORGANISM="Pelagodinium beii, Strain RCC1491" /NCGR_SAMPLE_ID=MMETSP1338 /ASSEMBLY_ACC=CAM_ASM_000754 /LENGTH=321 /DNA_ID=CAMNT_0043222917 /DNA_START=59 /DNA_END=1024 /DNA_ORIENTATION=+